MPSYVTPKKNTEYIFYLSLVSQTNTKVMQSNPTIAAGDFKVATNDEAPANLTTLPVVDADFLKRVKVTLSAAEMNGDNITLICSDAAGNEWCDLTINFQTTATQIDEIAGGVSDEALSGHQAQGTLGAAITMVAYLGPHGPGVYIDDGAANTGTTLGDDGTLENPVSTIAAATTIGAALGTQRFYLINNTALTLAQTYEDHEFVGIGMSNQVTLGSQDVDNTEFCNITLTGTQGGTQYLMAHNCRLQALLSLEIIADGCWLTGDLTLRAATNQNFRACVSAFPGNDTPDLNFPGSGVTTVNWRNGSGGLTVKNATASDVMSYESDGQIVIDATCTSLTISVRGNCTITDNGTTTALTQTAAINAVNIQNEVNDGLVALHLDHLLAVDYDPASKPGIATALLNELIESDGGISRYTANALEQGPGGGATAGAIADAVWDEAQADHVAVGSFGVIASEIATILSNIGTLGAGLTDLGGMSAGMKAEIESEVNDALVALNLDHFAFTATAIPAVPAGTWLKLMTGADNKVVVSTDAQDLSATFDVNTKTIAALAITAASIATDAITAAKIAVDAIGADEIAAAAANKIADHILRRTFANAKASSDGDAKSFRSLLGAVAKLINKIAISGSTLTVYEDDDSTALGAQTVTEDATADPITALVTV